MASASWLAKTVHPSWPETAALPSWVARPRRADEDDNDKDGDKAEETGKDTRWSGHPISVAATRDRSRRR